MSSLQIAKITKKFTLFEVFRSGFAFHEKRFFYAFSLFQESVLIYISVGCSRCFYYVEYRMQRLF